MNVIIMQPSDIERSRLFQQHEEQNQINQETLYSGVSLHGGMPWPSGVGEIAPDYTHQQGQLVGPWFSEGLIAGQGQSMMNWNDISSQAGMPTMNFINHGQPDFGGEGGGDPFKKRSKVDNDRQNDNNGDEEGTKMPAKKKVRVENTDEEPSADPVAPGMMHLSLNMDESTAPAPVPACAVGMSTFDDNDVLSGRGGGTNIHPGNRNFRDLINMHRRAYLKATKNDKPAISRAVVRAIRETGGKFLKKNEKEGQWYEIGDDAAREKASQAFRQRAPEMRKLLFDSEQQQVRAIAEEQCLQRLMVGASAGMGTSGMMYGGPTPQSIGSMNGMSTSVGAMIASNNSSSGPRGPAVDEQYPAMGGYAMMNPAFFQAMIQKMNQRHGGGPSADSHRDGL